MLVEEGYKSSLQHVELPFQESFLSLAVETRVFPKGLLHSSTEVLIFRDSALFFDWEQLVVVEIKNPSTVQIFKGMFNVLKLQSCPVR